MFDKIEMHRILVACCHQTRKGPEVVESEHSGLSVTEIFAMPPSDDPMFASDNFKKIDCHFMVVMVDMVAAEAERKAFTDLLDQWPDKAQLAGGPSYITVGATLGDQGAAFEMFALGEALDLWVVITPKLLGLKDQQAHKAAGMGYIMCSGYPRAK